MVLYQFVTLLRDGKQVKMSTRKATFVTVDELVDEVGPDALRFFFLMRKPDNLIEFVITSYSIHYTKLYEFELWLRFFQLDTQVVGRLN